MDTNNGIRSFINIINARGKFLSDIFSFAMESTKLWETETRIHLFENHKSDSITITERSKEKLTLNQDQYQKHLNKYKDKLILENHI